MPERRTAIIARRATLATQPAPRFRWPTYLVTAPHSVWQHPTDDHSRLPYSEWHVREVGGLETACGQPAGTWTIFWTLDFSLAGARACQECRSALAPPVVTRPTRDLRPCAGRGVCSD